MPRLTDAQQEALRLYNALAVSDRLRMDIMLQPGDIQLLSNHTQLHTRSAFVDHEVGRSGLPLLLAPTPGCLIWSTDTRDGHAHCSSCFKNLSDI